MNWRYLVPGAIFLIAGLFSINFDLKTQIPDPFEGALIVGGIIFIGASFYCFLRAGAKQ